jgi:peptidoglycan/LPS O-acetylase OafA/YrhL
MLLQTAYWGARSWAFCRSRIVRVVALLSYSLYLYHPLGSQIAYFLHLRHNGLVSALLVPVMAVASYSLVEKPFMRMRDRYSPHRVRAQEFFPAEAGRGSL